MDDLISRQAAIEHLKKRLYETALNNVTEHPYYEDMADNRVSVWLEEVPSAQPEIIRCKDCKHNPKDTWFECPMAALSEKQRPETAWCWKAERKKE